MLSAVRRKDGRMERWKEVDLLEVEVSGRICSQSGSQSVSQSISQSVSQSVSLSYILTNNQ